MTSWRLPKKVERDPAAGRLEADLVAHASPLWAGGDVAVPGVELFADLERALRSALVAGRVVRGLEGAEQALAADALGLEQVDRETGVQRGARISRLLVLADDGAQRFYRNAESLLRRHAPRVLGLRLRVDERGLGGLLFGEGQVARAVLIEHKDAVSAVLLQLAAHWLEAGPEGA